jgi:hypothetical protein
MPTPFKSVLFAAGITIGILGASATAEARCGYYVGYGYRCFGDKGGTGGKAFKKMDENSKKCGYFDPGCQGEIRKKSSNKRNITPNPK